MKRWADRSRVEASLLNPALIALLMAEAARGVRAAGRTDELAAGVSCSSAGTPSPHS